MSAISVGGDFAFVCSVIQSHCCPSSRRKCICLLLVSDPPISVPRIGHAVVVGVCALRFVSLSGCNGGSQRVADGGKPSCWSLKLAPHGAHGGWQSHLCWISIAPRLGINASASRCEFCVCFPTRGRSPGGVGRGLLCYRSK